MAQTHRLVYNSVVYRLVFSPVVMKLMAKYSFPLLTRYHTRYHSADDIVFLNFGYEEDPPMALPLAETDEPNRFPIQLYHRTATQADLKGKKVLEVGCGHGGGASYVMRTLHPSSYTGLDLNRAGIAFCRKRHNLAGLDFVRGDAEHLPFDDQSFDALINIESAHCYPHFSRFLAEVARVLRPGGHFLYTDLRPRVLVAEWEAALADAPLRMLSYEDIDTQVSRGMSTNSQRMPEPIDNRRVPVLHGVASEATASQSSGLYQAVHSGDFSYRMYCFGKD